ncbi:MAG TPA: ABC transporter ATP-binding protein [Acidimicrobiia bacterium]|nr:ABC transporter ATP-binding protein [Acidimicrobiia bacterium]
MLELRGIRAGYGRLPVLFDVDLTVEAGQWMTVVGANGAGRSTLLKTILGVTNVSAGEVLFNGERITHLATYDRIGRGIAMVPEGRRIFPNLSVKENLRTGANTISKRDVPGQMDRVYEVFPILDSRSGQRAGSLSGGEQQMLAVGRALMSRPQLLLVDELSLGLAPLVVATLTEALQKLCDQGLAVVVVDEVHVHSSSASASQRLVLEKGRFVANSAAAEDRLATVL